MDNSFEGCFFGNYPSMMDGISEQDDDDNPWSRNILYSKDGSEIYHIGIIDYLQTWSYSKRGEAMWKSRV